MELLSQLIRNLPVPAQLWAADGTVLLTNERFNELFHMPLLFDWQKHGLSLISDPQVRESGVDVIFKRALAGLTAEVHAFNYEPGQSEYAVESEAGTLTLFINLCPLLNAEGMVEYAACIITDYATGSARHESEQIRAQKMENIERLANSVAHEFNNIFTGIKGMTDLIKDEVDHTSEVYEFACIIESSIARGAELIQQLSSFARELPITLRRIRLSKYLERSQQLMQMHVTKRITIDTEILSDGDVLIDANRMDQALGNVLVNARDAMGGQGRIKITVDYGVLEFAQQLAAPPKDKWLMIEIADTGPGIPDELRERVLEPFFTTKERGKASGLGLSVTNRIVTSHNGLVKVSHSEELGGAAVQVFLPIAPPMDHS